MEWIYLAVGIVLTLAFQRWKIMKHNNLGREIIHRAELDAEALKKQKRARIPTITSRKAPGNR